MRILREDQRLFDVTLVIDDGQHIKAHKIILSAGSHFFSDIFLKSNKTNMLIYLKGIHSIQLEHLLDFFYNGEASVGKEELKEFLKTGTDLGVKSFEDYVSDAWGSEPEDPERNRNEREDMYENRENITRENNICDTLEPPVERCYSSDVTFKEAKQGKFQRNSYSDLDLQILEIIEKSDGVWKCKFCEKVSPKKSHIQSHAESHIEGISHFCHICNKRFSSRPSLRGHITDVHSELVSCDLCGRSGMNKKDYYNHKRKQRDKLSGTHS